MPDAVFHQLNLGSKKASLSHYNMLKYVNEAWNCNAVNSIMNMFPLVSSMVYLFMMWGQ